jgi:hypothetical protein
MFVSKVIDALRNLNGLFLQWHKNGFLNIFIIHFRNIMYTKRFTKGDFICCYPKLILCGTTQFQIYVGKFVVEKEV